MRGLRSHGRARATGCRFEAPRRRSVDAGTHGEPPRARRAVELRGDLPVLQTIDGEECSAYTLHRCLSATGIAASVLLHQQLIGEPYRDTAIGYHWRQQWRLAPVRDIARRNAPGRARLERIQRQMLERPLPSTGELTMAGQDGTTQAADGDRLWARAEVLFSLLQPRPEPDIGQTPGHNTSRQLSLTLSDLLATIEPARLDLLVATPHR